MYGSRVIVPRGFFSLILLLGSTLSSMGQVRPSFTSLSVATGEVKRRSNTQTDFPDLGRITYNSLYADLGMEAASGFSWADAFDNPKTGLTLLGSSYSSPSIDYVIGLLAFISNEYSLFGTSLSWYYHAGWGITYTGNTFDIETNYSNETVSTNLNASTDVRTGLSLRISENWRIRAGGALFHSSNVGVKKPNYGINQYNLMLGVNYQFRKDGPPLDVNERPMPEQEFLLMGHIAPRQVAYNDPYLLVGDLNFEYNRLLNRAIRAGVGMTLMEDGIAYEHKKYFKPVEGESYKPLGFAESLSFGTHLNLELVFNGLSLVGQVGYYWRHPYRSIKESPDLPEAYANYMEYTNEKYIYNRIGYRYRFKSGLIISLIGKTQLLKIQFTELGVGYSF